MPDGLKRPRLLLRLDAEIAAPANPVQAACKRAERAVCLARLARFDEARAEIGDLQHRVQPLAQIETSIWLHLAQGVLSYYENVGACDGDHLRRAHAIAVASSHMLLQALCAAWLALWELARLDLPSVAQRLREALRLADPQQHAARARAGLVAAQALHMAGRGDLARRWYQSARHHAVLDGDDASLSALMHNMAWAHLMLLRQSVLTGATGDAAAPEVTTHLASSDQFDEMLGSAPWRSFRPLLKAQALSLQGDPAGALRCYEAHAVDPTGAATGASEQHGESRMLARLKGAMLADKAWCLSAVGHRDAAHVCAQLAVQAIADDDHLDDRAAAHSRLAQVHAALGAARLAQHHDEIAAQAWHEHRLAQAKTVELLAGLETGWTG